MNDTPISSATSSTWRLDEPYRFQLAFFRKDLLSPTASDVFSVPPHLKPDNKPDIDNIVLSQFLQRGFLPKLKAQGSEKFYLKLFEFPKNISPSVSSEKILKKFLLTETHQGQELQRYVAQRQNIFVKLGYISPVVENFSSFPKFLIPNDSVTAQEYFDNFLPFSSLYVLPLADAKLGLSDEERIEHSYGGVVGFRQELLGIYRSTFKEIEMVGEDNMFVDETQYGDGTTTTVPKISVITLKQSDYFKEPPENFRERLLKRPMPLNSHDFLSSLLLVHYTDFISNEKGVVNVPSTKEELDRNWRPDLDSNHVLEIASVVRLENI
jgi:hypothetical protein